jgi:hypothetical protein
LANDWPLCTCGKAASHVGLGKKKYPVVCSLIRLTSLWGGTQWREKTTEGPGVAVTGKMEEGKEDKPIIADTHDTRQCPGCQL